MPMKKKATRPKRVYTDFERVAVMTIALRDGIVRASVATQTPERTIYSWFADAGGLAEIRNFAVMAADHALSTAEVAICNEVARRAGLEGGFAGAFAGMSDGELMLTFRALVEARATAKATASAGAAAGAQANAQIHNWTVTIKE